MSENKKKSWWQRITDLPVIGDDIKAAADTVQNVVNGAQNMVKSAYRQWNGSEAVVEEAAEEDSKPTATAQAKSKKKKKDSAELAIMATFGALAADKQDAVTQASYTSRADIDSTVPVTVTDSGKALAHVEKIPAAPRHPASTEIAKASAPPVTDPTITAQRQAAILESALTADKEEDFQAAVKDANEAAEVATIEAETARAETIVTFLEETVAPESPATTANSEGPDTKPELPTAEEIHAAGIARAERESSVAAIVENVRNTPTSAPAEEPAESAEPLYVHTDGLEKIEITGVGPNGEERPAVTNMTAQDLAAASATMAEQRAIIFHETGGAENGGIDIETETDPERLKEAYKVLETLTPPEPPATEPEKAPLLVDDPRPMPPQAVVATTPEPKPVRKVERDPEIGEMQEKLNKYGFDCGAADKIYGPKTDAALRAFCMAYGGPEIDKALPGMKRAALIKTFNRIEKTLTAKSIKDPKNTEGPEKNVIGIQKQLNTLHARGLLKLDEPVAVTGVPDRQTAGALARFQAMTGETTLEGTLQVLEDRVKDKMLAEMRPETTVPYDTSLMANASDYDSETNQYDEYPAQTDELNGYKSDTAIAVTGKPKLTKTYNEEADPPEEKGWFRTVISKIFGASSGSDEPTAVANVEKDPTLDHG